MTYNIIFPIGCNFPIVSTQLCQISALWKIKITFPNVFLLYLRVKNCFPALLYIICGSAAERNFTPIISSCVSLCSIILCCSRKLPSKALPDRVRFCLTDADHLNSILKNITAKSYFACCVITFCQNSTLFPRCGIL